MEFHGTGIRGAQVPLVGNITTGRGQCASADNIVAHALHAGGRVVYAMPCHAPDDGAVVPSGAVLLYQGGTGATARAAVPGPVLDRWIDDVGATQRFASRC